jgi:peptide deformylase
MRRGGWGKKTTTDEEGKQWTNPLFDETLPMADGTRAPKPSFFTRLWEEDTESGTPGSTKVGNRLRFWFAQNHRALFILLGVLAFMICLVSWVAISDIQSATKATVQLQQAIKEKVETILSQPCDKLPPTAFSSGFTAHGISLNATETLLLYHVRNENYTCATAKHTNITLPLIALRTSANAVTMMWNTVVTGVVNSHKTVAPEISDFFPDLLIPVEVERPREVAFEYNDVNGKRHAIKAADDASRCIMHCMEILDGRHWNDFIPKLKTKNFEARK